MRESLQTEALTLRIPARLARRLHDATRAEDRSISEFVRELLRRELLGGAGGGGGGADARSERTAAS